MLQVIEHHDTSPLMSCSNRLLSDKIGAVGKQSHGSVDHNLAGREMRFVGHRAGNLTLAWRRVQQVRALPSRLLASRADTAIASQQTVLSTKPHPSALGSPMAVLCFHATGRGLPRHGIGEVW